MSRAAFARFSCRSVTVALLLIPACGHPAPPRESLDASEERRSMPGAAAGEAARGGADLTKGLELLAGEARDPVPPVSFHELFNFFPELEGWARTRPTGERTATPVAYAQAVATYRSGGAEIEASIVDSGFNRVLIAPYAMFLTAGFERSTEEGYEKALKVEGFPAWEKWDRSGSGELNALVGGRFLVRYEGSQLAGTDVLHQLAASSELPRLARLK
jgi:hypothetical protein